MNKQRKFWRTVNDMSYSGWEESFKIDEKQKRQLFNSKRVWRMGTNILCLLFAFFELRNGFTILNITASVFGTFVISLITGIVRGLLEKRFILINK